MNERHTIETQLVAYAVQQPRGYVEAVALGIAPSHFSDEALRAIWSLYGASLDIGAIAGPIQQIPNGFNRYMEILKEDYRTSQSVAMAKVTAQSLLNLHEWAWVESEWAELERAYRLQTDLNKLGEACNQIASRLLEKKTSKAVTRYEAGLAFIESKKTPLADPVRLAINVPVQDHVLRNILPGEMVVVAARAGHGKTAWALQVAQESAKLGTKVLFITGEMRASELYARMASQETGINGRELRTDDLEPWHLDQLAAENEKWKNRTLVIEDMGKERTGRDVCNMIRRGFMSGFQVVIVDYVGKVRGGKFFSRHAEMEDLATCMKAEAVNGNGVVIALAQLNRAASTEKKDKEIDTAYIADSDAWGREADFVQFLSQHDDDRRVTHVSVTKARHGEPVKFALQFNGGITRFVGEAHIAPQQPKKGGW